jgi:PRC-barrel domain
MDSRRRLKGWAAALAASLIAASIGSAFHPLRAAETPGQQTDSPAPPSPGPAEAPAVTPPPDTVAPVKEPPKPPENLEPLPKEGTITVLGKKVRGAAGEDMGRVVDLLLDRDAQIQAVVIDFGGFLGVGSRKIAIDWRLVQFRPEEREAPLALSLGRAEVQAAPEYKDTAQPPVMVGQPPPPPEPPPADPTPADNAAR